MPEPEPTRATRDESEPAPPRRDHLQCRAASRILRSAVLFLVVLFAAGYTVGVLTGKISQGNRIDVAHLALIGLTALVVLLVLRPDLPAQIRTLKLGALELQMLERVGEQVKETSNQLEDLRLILPLLLPETEQQHLVNLANGHTGGYQGRPELQSELRRLRFLRLIRMKRGYIADLRDGKVFDLGDHVELMPLGEQLVDRIERMRREGGPEA